MRSECIRAVVPHYTMRSHHSLFVLLRRALLPVLLVLTVSLTSAAEAAKIKFDVAPGTAGRTLKEFAQQAKREIMFPTQRVDNVQTNAVRGEMTVREGLDQLLAGTELKVFEDQKTGALVVQRADDPNGPGAAQKNSDRPETKTEGPVVELDTFEVFGSKLINLDLPRTRDDAQPYVVFGRGQITKTQATNLDDFFRTRLPMNTTVGSESFGVGQVTFATVNLRGLGTNQTLILVDGRRVP